jgi:hypothetical protein
MGVSADVWWVTDTGGSPAQGPALPRDLFDEWVRKVS